MIDGNTHKKTPPSSILTARGHFLQLTLRKKASTERKNEWQDTKITPHPTPCELDEE
jgi:hypothetical protein